MGQFEGPQWVETRHRSPASSPGGGYAPIAAVQTSGTISPKRSFVGAVANGRVGWERDIPNLAGL
jgi:hypothetical protein